MTPIPGFGSRILRSTRLAKLAILIGLVVIWQGLSEVSPRDILPSPAVTLSAFVSLVTLRSVPSLPQALGLTLAEILGAFALAAVLGVSTAVLFSSSSLLRAAFTPMVIALFAIPHIIVFPLFIVAFGLGALSKVAYGFLAAYPVVVLGGYAAISRVDRATVLSARSLGVRGATLLTRVVVPASFSSIVGTLRVAFGVTIVTTIVAEMIGSVGGLGYDLRNAYQSFETPDYLAMAIAIMVLALLLNFGAFLLESRVKRWQRD